MFLFEVKPRLKTLPPHHVEGRFQFFTRAALEGLKLPQTDREQICPGSGGIAADFSRRTAIAIPTGATTGR